MGNETDTAVREIALDVYQTLGSGHSESVYDNAMQVGLRVKGLKYESQKVLELTYREHYVGYSCPDLVVGSGDDTIVVELKAVAGKLGPSEKQQVRNYMKLLNVKRGLLINFPQPGKNAKEPEIIEVPEE
jgi:GxxExxY protein